MAAYFNLTLDTTAPSAVSVAFKDGITIAGSRTVDLVLAATGATHMKIYGDIGAAGVPTAEASAAWVTYATTSQVTLTTGDGTKTVKVKFKDIVDNVSIEATKTITLDTTAATVTITGPDVSTISKMAGFKTSIFSFSADTAFVEYKVKVVPATGSAHTAGALVPTTKGSLNTSGAAGNYAASIPVQVTLIADDVETASAGDGVKIIKVFALDAGGNWSV